MRLSTGTSGSATSCAGAHGLADGASIFQPCQLQLLVLDTLLIYVHGMMFHDDIVLRAFRFRTVWSTFCASPDPNPASTKY